MPSDAEFFGILAGKAHPQVQCAFVILHEPGAKLDWRAKRNAVMSSMNDVNYLR
jgi:hypothetical protein